MPPQISADPKGPLFRTIGRTTGQLTTTPLPQANAHAMIRRRAGVAEVLMEYFQQVRASDVFDYGCGYEVGSFVGCGPDVATVPSVPDWIITNPPFNLACEFALRAVSIARAGVALLARSAWSKAVTANATCFRSVRQP